MKKLVLFLLLVMIVSPALAVAGSAEAGARSFWTEFDLVFWQTLPFAAFWGSAIATQLVNGGAVNWTPVMSAALVISAGNAVIHARRVAK
jgi:hypothetical protein